MNVMRYNFVSRPGRRVLVSSALLLCFLIQLPKLKAQTIIAPAAIASAAHKELFTKPAPMSSASSTPSSSTTTGAGAGSRSSGIVGGGDFNSAPPVEQQLHLVVGKSTFINTRHRLTRVYVTSPSILDTYTASPNQVVVTAKKPGISSLILWDESGESQAFDVTSDLNVDLLRNSLREALPNQEVTVDGTQGRVVLTGTMPTQSLADTAGKIAAQYSLNVTNALVVNSSQVKQVRLQVRIVEVDRSKLNAFAFNFFNSGGNILGATTTGQATSSLSVSSGSGGSGGSSFGGKSVSVVNPLNFLLYSSKLNIGATLQDLETLGCLQILSEPNITAMSGEKADFLAGGEFPFPVVQGGSGGLTSITIQFRPYGVKLEFTPLVNPDGTIELKVAPEVSSLDYTNSVQISGYTIPALSTRKAETQLVLRNGETFALGGLLDRRTTDQFENTPGIASIPILGQLFKSKNVNHATQELVVIVTPTIIDPLTDNTVPGEPKLPIKFLDATTFDKKIPEPKNP